MTYQLGVALFTECRNNGTW